MSGWWGVAFSISLLREFSEDGVFQERMEFKIQTQEEKPAEEIRIQKLVM